MSTWQPSLGAILFDDNTAHFRLWAPERKSVNLVLKTITDAHAHSASMSAHPPKYLLKHLPMQHDPEHKGYFFLSIEKAEPGMLYAYDLGTKVNEWVPGGMISFAGPFPDPCSRFQTEAEGVHGFSSLQPYHPIRATPSLAATAKKSEVAKAGEEAKEWKGMTMSEISSGGAIYELHVGCFTLEGTLRAAAAKIPHLEALGVSAIELCPLAAFPGSRGWGYDGVLLSAVHASYGTREDLVHFVRVAHEHGMAVILDVVYNHLGPDGNYLSQFSSEYFNPEYPTPWGAGLNFSNPEVRKFFIENALLWLHEFDVDGFRLDATHAIVDPSSEKHFLQELNEELTTAAARLHRLPPVLIAEDDRNSIKLLQAPPQGYGLSGAWADDLHHQLHVRLTGEQEGYYREFSGSTEDIAATIRKGWFFTGQHLPSSLAQSEGKAEAEGEEHLPSSLAQQEGKAEAEGGEHKPKTTRGEGDPDKANIPYYAFTTCLQNHDQIGNRAFGSRLHQIPGVSMEAYHAAVCTLLFLPHTPLLFMGEEWAASTPFCFFTDHKPELGKLVTEGRRREFSHFSAFADPSVRETIPDPQAFSTFTKSKLHWDEVRSSSDHAQTLAMYKRLLQLRRTVYPTETKRSELKVASIINALVVCRLVPKTASAFLLIANFDESAEVRVELREFLHSECNLGVLDEPAEGRKVKTAAEVIATALHPHHLNARLLTTTDVYDEHQQYKHEASGGHKAAPVASPAAAISEEKKRQGVILLDPRSLTVTFTKPGAMILEVYEA